MSSNHQPDFSHHPSPEDWQEPVSPHVLAQQKMEDARYTYLPKSLHGRLPQTWILALETNNKKVLQVLLLILAYITLFASVIGRPHSTEFASILAAVLAPISFTIWYIIFPLNPYQTFFFKKQGLAGLDEKDEAAKELVKVLSSPSAAGFLWKCAQRFWLYFLLPMAVVVLVMHQIPHWAAGLSWVIRIPLFFFFVFCLLRVDMLSWAIGIIKSNE